MVLFLWDKILDFAFVQGFLVWALKENPILKLSFRASKIGRARDVA